MVKLRSMSDWRHMEKPNECIVFGGIMIYVACRLRGQITLGGTPLLGLQCSQKIQTKRNSEVKEQETHVVFPSPFPIRLVLVTGLQLM